MIPLRSKITQKLLNYFFLNPEESLYLNELSRKLNVDKRNLVKKARELEKEDILKSHTRGNLKLYSINKNYLFYKEFKKIFLKTVGLENQLKTIIKSVAGIKYAWIYGSYARNKMDTHSDLDVLIVGNHDIVKLQRKLSHLQKELDREINTVNLGDKEYTQRLKKRDPFISQIIKGKHIKLL